MTGVAETRDGALGLVEKYHDRHLADRVFELAWTHSQVVLRQLDATEADTQLYGRLASSILYANPLLRAPGSVIARNRRGQSGLWGYGISGDLPIVLLRDRRRRRRSQLVRQLVQAHAYWRVKGLTVDLVIWNEDQSGYRQVLQDQIMGVIASRAEANLLDQPGRHLRPPHRADVGGGQGADADGRPRDHQRHRRHAGRAGGPPGPRRDGRARVQRRHAPAGPRPRSPSRCERHDLVAFNGIGGFTQRRPRVRHHHHAPSRRRRRRGSTCWPTRGSAPSSARAAARTRGARTPTRYRLTPWHNDPVSDASGEAFYVRDEETGRFWSPDAAARARADAVHDPARVRLQHLRVHRGRHHHGDVDVRRDRRAGEVRRPQAAQQLRRGRGGCR